MVFIKNGLYKKVQAVFTIKYRPPKIGFNPLLLGLYQSTSPRCKGLNCSQYHQTNQSQPTINRQLCRVIGGVGNSSNRLPAWAYHMYLAVKFVPVQCIAFLVKASVKHVVVVPYFVLHVVPPFWLFVGFNPLLYGM